MAFQIPATISTKSLITAGKFLIPSVAVATPVGTTISESLTRQQVEVLLEETRKLNQKLEGERDEVERKALREIETKTEEVEKIFGVKMQALMENVKIYREMMEKFQQENENLRRDKGAMWGWHQNREEKVKKLEKEIEELKNQNLFRNTDMSLEILGQMPTEFSWSDSSFDIQGKAVIV